MVVDAQTGLHPLDDDVAGILRRKRRPIVLAANKAEAPNAAASVVAEFGRLGFGEPVAVSAIHGEGTGDLLDRIVELLPPQISDAQVDGELALAVIGRPNVGKSSLVNALLGEERTLVSQSPGTTRDAIDAAFRMARTDPFVWSTPQAFERNPKRTGRSSTTRRCDRWRRSRDATSRCSSSMQ